MKAHVCWRAGFNLNGNNVAAAASPSQRDRVMGGTDLRQPMVAYQELINV
jgi:hypothetical protein